MIKSIINGQPVDERHPLVSLLLEHVAGETVTVDILRDGQTFQIELTLGERPNVTADG